MASSEWDSFPVIAAAGAAAFVGVSLAYLAWSASRPASSVLEPMLTAPMPMFGGSRSVNVGNIPPGQLNEIIRELDPIDSLYFDVSVAFHALRSVDYSNAPSEMVTEAIQRARLWLGIGFALSELMRSRDAGYITQDEYDRIFRQINEVARYLNYRAVNNAVGELSQLQSWLAQRLYSLVIQKAKSKGV